MKLPLITVVVWGTVLISIGITQRRFLTRLLTGRWHWPMSAKKAFRTIVAELVKRGWRVCHGGWDPWSLGAVCIFEKNGRTLRLVWDTRDAGVEIDEGPPWDPGLPRRIDAHWRALVELPIGPSHRNEIAVEAILGAVDRD